MWNKTAQDTYKTAKGDLVSARKLQLVSPNALGHSPEPYTVNSILQTSFDFPDQDDHDQSKYYGYAAIITLLKSIPVYSKRLPCCTWDNYSLLLL